MKATALSKLLDRLKQIRLPSLSFRLSASIITVLVVAVSIFILGGGVYDIIQGLQGELIALLPTPSYPQFYYQGMSDQTFNESAYFILFLIIGVSGGYISFRSSRHAYHPKEARMLLLIGIAMMLVATIGCEVILSWKGL